MTTVEPIITRVAHTGADELRFQGHKVFADLLGKCSVGQMLVLGISGKLLDPEAIAIVDEIVTVMSSADPRLWPFKVTRLGAAFGTASNGVAATLVSSEGGMYGANRLYDIVRWFREVAASPVTDEAICTSLDRSSPGFGVKFRAHDERFDALVRRLHDTGRDGRPFIQLCLRTVRVAREQRQLEPHAFMAIAALCLDLDLPDPAIAAFAGILLFHDALANACEGAVQAPASLREVPRSMVQFCGTTLRRSPRAEQAG